MPFLFLEPAVYGCPYFPAELVEELILDHVAAVGKLQFDSACLQHIEPNIQGQWAFRWRCWNNAGKAVERFVNACAVEIPVFVAIMHIVGEVGGKPHLHSVDHFTMNRTCEKILSRQ